MKQIIVPTDFSAPAENAMLFAGQLAQKANATLVLLNVFQVPVNMSDVPLLLITSDELKRNADNALQNARETLAKVYPGLMVITESRLGNVADELEGLSEEILPFAIVMGSHSASGLERFFLGSTSLSVVRHSRIPVIVVPENNTSRTFSRIALAIDDHTETLPKEKIKAVMEAFGADLHIIHVQTNHTETIEFGPRIAGLNATCRTIRDDEFLHGIETYLVQNSIDMLMVLPHKHSFLERLTFRTHTEELLRKLTIPVICINEEADTD